MFCEWELSLKFRSEHIKALNFRFDIIQKWIVCFKLFARSFRRYYDELIANYNSLMFDILKVIAELDPINGRLFLIC